MYFCEIFHKIQFAILTFIKYIYRSYSYFRFNRIYSRVIENILKTFRIKLNVSTLKTLKWLLFWPIFKVQNYFELLNLYSEVN